MPVMKGREPIRRTLEYLMKGDLIFKKNVKVMIVNYNINQTASKGAYNFVFWNLAQIQYKNPLVQIVTFKNLTPNPFIQFYFGNGKNRVVDVYGKGRQEILDHLKDTFCVDESIAMTPDKKNPAFFGYTYNRHCICEIPGQVPCPGRVELPKNLRGKYKSSEDTKDS